MIWVLTSGFGDGHNSAARSVADALRRSRPDETIVVSDLLMDVHPLVSTVLQSGYRFVITRFPWLWRLAYGWFARPSLGNSARWLLTITAALDARLERDSPSVIVSTYPLYSGLLAFLKSKGRPVPPLITVITDSITVHPSWTMAPSDLICVADDETKLRRLPSESLSIQSKPPASLSA